MAVRPSIASEGTVEFSFSAYMEQVESFLKDKLIPTCLKHMEEQMRTKGIVTKEEDLAQVGLADKQIVSTKKREAQGRLSKYLDTFESVSLETTMNSSVYEEFFEKKRQEKELQRAQQQRINELVEEYTRKKRQQLLQMELRELSRQLEAATITHTQPEQYLQASKDFEKVLQYQENVIKCLDVFEKKLVAKLEGHK